MDVRLEISLIQLATASDSLVLKLYLRKQHYSKATPTLLVCYSLCDALLFLLHASGQTCDHRMISSHKHLAVTSDFRRRRLRTVSPGASSGGGGGPC